MHLSAVTFVSNHLPLGRLPEAISAIDAYLDVTTTFTLERASEAGFPRLVERLVLMRESGVDVNYLAHVCNLGIDRAAAVGNLPVIEEFVLRFPWLFITNAATVAAEHQQLHILDWLWSRGTQVIWTDSVFSAAVKSLITLRHVATHFDITLDARILYDAVAYSTDDVIQYVWLAFAARGYIGRLGGFAVSRAPLELATWMVANTSDPIVISVDFAASDGNLEYVQWAFGLAPPRVSVTWTSRAIDMAAAGGHIGVVELLHAHGVVCTSDAIDEASANGHLAIVQFLYREQGVSGTPGALYNAAVNGHLELFRWLHLAYPHLQCPTETFDAVCAAGRIDVARALDTWRVGGGTVRAMESAAANGHLDMVKWLDQVRDEGCTTRALDDAASGGHHLVVEWLHKNRDEGATTAAMDGAASNGHMQMARWLHEYRSEGCSPVAMQRAAQSGDIAMVTWLHQEYPWFDFEPAVDHAVASGNIDLVRWLLRQRRERPSQQAMESAAANEDFPMCELLRERGAPAPTSTYAFVSSLNTGNLYMAGRIASNYPGAADIGYLASHRGYTCWTEEVLQRVFGIQLV